MKVLAPPHVCGPISHNGRSFELSEDRCLDVSELEAALLAPHGFTLLDESLDAGVHPAPAADGVSAEDILAMNRVDLFAFLRSRGVAIAPPVRNDDLRARALAELAPSDRR